MRMFWTLLVIDVAVLLVVSFVFLASLGDDPIEVFSRALWLPLFCVSVVALAGGLWLNAKGRAGLAKVLLAVPAVLFGGAILIVVMVFATYVGAFR